MATDFSTGCRLQVTGYRLQVTGCRLGKSEVFVGTFVRTQVRYGVATFNSFEEMEVWKAARELTRKIYHLTNEVPFAKDWGLRDQICRAAVSVMSNIAEGCESQTRSTFIRHLGIAKGSAGEVRSQLYVALDQEYIAKTEFDAVSELCRKIARQLSRFMDYLRRHDQ